MILFRKEEEKQNIKETSVEIEEVEDIIRIINTVADMDCYFELDLTLAIGTFSVDSYSFDGIKLLKKGKNENDRVLISHSDALIKTDTTINIKDIYKICFSLKYYDKDSMEML